MSDGYIGDLTAPAPDLIEKVVGVRGFDRAGHMLASPFQGDGWRKPERAAVCAPSRPSTAAALLRLGLKPPKASSAAAGVVAHQQRLPRHSAPGDNCVCGIYAYYSITEAVIPAWPIVAAVQAWGKLVLHAYPVTGTVATPQTGTVSR
jgi:hypothetical protein